MKFSVIIPAYNAEDTIERAKRSIPEGCEIIVANDPEQYGPGWARNQGLEMAGGDWILFLDADDYYLPGALEKLEEACQGDVDLVNFAPRDAEYWEMPKQELLNNYLELKMDGSVVFTAFRRDLLHKMVFAEGLHEDIDFLHQAIMRSHCHVHLAANIYHKTYREGSIVNSMSNRRIDGYLRAWKAIGERIFDEEKAHYEIGTRKVTEVLSKAIQRCGTKEHFEYLRSKVPTWSCPDIQGSLFLAPTGPRVCCQRFFVDGNIRGDVEARDRSSLTLRINADEDNPCAGCPHLKFQQWDEPKVRYLSHEQYRICNLRCTYCSKEYYDGGESNFCTDEDLSNVEHVVFGGGEPTMDPLLCGTVMSTIANLPQAKVRILTNSTNFSETVANAIRKGASITTSLDAGTPETYAKIRGADMFHQVLENLKRYAEIAPHRVTLKYILTDVNARMREVSEFCDATKGLRDCNVQISYDFREETMSASRCTLSIDMMHVLAGQGFDVVFFDDLWRSRAPADIAVGPWAADYRKFPFVAIWGAGRMAEMLLKTHFFQMVDYIIVDDTRAGQKLNGTLIQHPDLLKEAHMPIVIAASQSYPEIYWSLEKRGIDPKRVLKKAIV